MSTTTTLLPRSARPAAVVRPTYPAPITATLLIPRGLSQHGFVGRDRGLRRAEPAELLRPLDAGDAPLIPLMHHPRRRMAKRVDVPVVDQQPGIIDDLGQARVAERRHRATAGH